MDRTRRSPQQNRDIVVIGASAGGVAALERLIPALPVDLAAAVFVVLHVGRSPTRLHEILAQRAAIPVRAAINGAVFERRHVYTAPPDQHLILHGDHILLRRSASENMTRPAADPLFRSAAASFGSRVIGVVLTGGLSDGTAGLRAIKRCGGVAVVQDPADAVDPDMPRSALRHVDVDHCAPIAEMAALISRLTAQPAGPSPAVPLDLRVEAAIAAQEPRPMERLDKLGAVSRFTCPECGGDLWEITDGSLLRYRCHVGHAYNADVIEDAQSREMERQLWTLLRLHQERAEFARRQAAHYRALQNGRSAAGFEERVRRYEQDAELIRELLRVGSERADPELGIKEAEKAGIGDR
jgi:two-component system, chemotaxis family, protein-glutamate methylesterase/glutaminase